jgi:hypothetical protein
LHREARPKAGSRRMGFGCGHHRMLGGGGVSRLHRLHRLSSHFGSAPRRGEAKDAVDDHNAHTGPSRALPSLGQPGQPRQAQARLGLSS